MKRFINVIMSVLVLFFAVTTAVWAAETKEETTLRKEAAAISKTANSSQGEKIVTARLDKEFNVTDAQIQALRDKKLGYGEIAIVYSLAQKMPGGITDANISEVMTMRQGPPVMGWGQIANKLGTKLGPAVSQVKNVNRETSREMHREAKGGGSGSGAMEQSQERDMDRHGEMGGHGGSGAGGSGSSHGKSAK